NDFARRGRKAFACDSCPVSSSRENVPNLIVASFLDDGRHPRTGSPVLPGRDARTPRALGSAALESRGSSEARGAWRTSPRVDAGTRDVEPFSSLVETRHVGRAQ